MTAIDPAVSNQSADRQKPQACPSVQDRCSPPRRKVGESSLAYELRKNGIPVLNKKAVRAYKKAVFWNQKGNWFVKVIIGLPNDVLLTSCVVLVFSLISLFAAVPFGFVGFVTLGTALISAGIIISSATVATFFGHHILVWRPIPFYLYRKGEVPPGVYEFVEKATSAIPEGKIFVESFGRDPFAVVCWNNEKECIAAWNEQGLVDFDVS